LARINIHEIGSVRERDAVWGLISDDISDMVQRLRSAANGALELSDALKEQLRQDVAELNNCGFCKLPKAEVTKRFSESDEVVEALRRFTRNFVVDPESISREHVDYLRQQVGEQTVVALALFTARNMAFGRIGRVLRLDEDE